MRRSIVLLAVALTLPTAGCMAKPRHLVYPRGVTFIGWHVPNFEVCTWLRDPNNPQPCPLVVHLPTGDLGDKELSDAKALERAGWAARDAGDGRTELTLRANPPAVVCSYQAGVLAGVSVGTLSGNGGGPGTFSVNGKRVSLPATDGAITQVLGEPLRRD